MTSQTRSRIPFLRALLVLAVLGSALAASIACGGGNSTPAPTTGATKAQGTPTTITAGGAGQKAGGTPGTVWITSGPITGQNGTILLVFAAPAVGGQQVAHACVRITSDSFSIPATVLTDIPAGDNPCGGSTPQTVLPKGKYELRAGIYVPPASQAEKESTQTVEITGDVALQVELSGLSKN